MHGNSNVTRMSNNSVVILTRNNLQEGRTQDDPRDIEGSFVETDREPIRKRKKKKDLTAKEMENNL